MFCQRQQIECEGKKTKFYAGKDYNIDSREIFTQCTFNYTPLFELMAFVSCVSEYKIEIKIKEYFISQGISLSPVDIIT